MNQIHALLNDALREHCAELHAADHGWSVLLADALDLSPAERADLGMTTADIAELHRLAMAARCEAAIATRNPLAFVTIEVQFSVSGSRQVLIAGASGAVAEYE